MIFEESTNKLFHITHPICIQDMSLHVPIVHSEAFLKKLIGDPRFPRVIYPIIFRYALY